MQWHGVQQLRRWLGSFKKFLAESGETRPARKRSRSAKPKKLKLSLKERSSVAILLLAMPLLSGCGLFETKPLPLDPRPSRPCFQWLVAKDQQVYIYDKGSMIAQLEAEPYDAVISGWCLLQYNRDLANEIKRLSH